MPAVTPRCGGKVQWRSSRPFRLQPGIPAPGEALAPPGIGADRQQPQRALLRLERPGRGRAPPLGLDQLTEFPETKSGKRHHLGSEHHALGILSGLPRHGRLMAVELPDGLCRTALDRKGCCQHFRIPGAEACSSCPRWPAAERLQRIRQELQASD